MECKRHLWSEAWNRRMTKDSIMHCLFLALLFVDMQAFRAPCLPVPSLYYWINNPIHFNFCPNLFFPVNQVCVCVTWAFALLAIILVVGAVLFLFRRREVQSARYFTMQTGGLETWPLQLGKWLKIIQGACSPWLKSGCMPASTLVNLIVYWKDERIMHPVVYIIY